MRKIRLEVRKTLNETKEELLAQLCPEIRAILDEQLAAGSQILYVSRGFFDIPIAICVTVRNEKAKRWEFYNPPSSYAACVFNDAGDPQWGLGYNYFCKKHKHIIIAA